MGNNLFEEMTGAIRDRDYALSMKDVGQDYKTRLYEANGTIERIRREVSELVNVLKDVPTGPVKD